MNKMPLSEIRRVLERGEWWEYLRETDPDCPDVWSVEINDAVEAALSALDELQAYRDAEQDGRLVKCPVKYNQTVYIVQNYGCGIPVSIIESPVDTFEYGNGRTPIHGWKFSPFYAPPFRESDIGQTVFFTRAEAEAALKGGGA